MAMDFELKKSVQVMNKEEGQYDDCNKIEVSYTGRKGLKALKHLQDVVFQTFQETSKASSGVTKEKAKKDEDVTADDVLAMLEMTGNSERVFDEVMSSLEHFATIGSDRLRGTIQEDMDGDDLDGLYQEVLKHFLLPKVTRMMNSMSK